MRCLIALGSNLGDRGAHLRAALSALGRLPRTRLLAASSFHETPPEAPADGGPFLNAAALVETGLPPRALLRRLLEVERRRGRRRGGGGAGGHGGPRPLDLDLVLYGARRLSQPGLEVPHPRFRGRAFVLAPAAEVAPTLRDPVTGLTVAALLAALRRHQPAPRRG